MGIGARWKHFKICVLLAANFVSLILSSLEKLAKVLGGTPGRSELVGGERMRLTPISCKEQAVLFLQIFAPETQARPATGGIAARSAVPALFSGSRSEPA